MTLVARGPSIEQACYWLARRPERAVTALPASRAADVAIVGAGLAGLWTALFLKQLEPACDVVVLEQGRIAAYVTDLIHPEAVFMLHGFGTDVPAKKRSFGKGLADQLFMQGKLGEWDPAGGGLNLAESFVTVTRV